MPTRGLEGGEGGGTTIDYYEHFFCGFLDLESSRIHVVQMYRHLFTPAPEWRTGKGEQSVVTADPATSCTPQEEKKRLAPICVGYLGQNSM